MLSAISKSAKVEGNIFNIMSEKEFIGNKKKEMKRKNQTSILQFSKKREKKQIQFLEVSEDNQIETEVVDLQDKTINDEMEKENEGVSLPDSEINV